MTYDVIAALSAAVGLSARALIKAGAVDATILVHGEALTRIENKLDQLLIQQAVVKIK